MFTGKFRSFLMILAAFICFFSSPAAGADERLLVNASINGKPARFAFDTGAETIFLFRQAAVRLGLRITNAPPDVELKPGQVRAGWTEKCRLTLWGSSVETPCPVLDVPSYLPFRVDGFLGWSAMKSNIFSIDATGLTVTPLDAVSREAKKWTCIRLKPGSNFLQFELPGTNGETVTVNVDTGTGQGVMLHPKRWHEWRESHSRQAVTLIARYMPGAGLVVSEEMWAGNLSFGPLALTDVPVMEANSVEVALGGPRFEASLGLAALKRFDFIVDGRNDTAYLHLKTTPPSPYQHDRIGAVFVPRDSGNDDLVARVVEVSPASEAGIRRDDVLLKIGELDVTKWRTDTAILPLSRFREQPAGTHLEVALKRGDEEFKTTVILRDILAPDTSALRQTDLGK